MKTIGYTYEADFHCIRHAEERFPALIDIAKKTRPPIVRDNEGNMVSTVLDIDEWDSAQTCPECFGEHLEARERGERHRLPVFEGTVIGDPY